MCMTLPITGCANSVSRLQMAQRSPVSHLHCCLQKPNRKRQWLFVLLSPLCGCHLYNLVRRYTVEDRNVGLSVKLQIRIALIREAKDKKKTTVVPFLETDACSQALLLYQPGNHILICLVSRVKEMRKERRHKDTHQPPPAPQPLISPPLGSHACMQSSNPSS